MNFIFRIYAPDDINGFNIFIFDKDEINALEKIKKKYPYAKKIIINKF